MASYLLKRKSNLFYRLISSIVLFAFLFSFTIFPENAYSQNIESATINLSKPGTMLARSDNFAPLLLQGITVNPNNPLQFDFIISRGDSDFEGKEFLEESTKLIKYFLTALTVPDEELWVNLSPYEKDRIVPDRLGVTEMGVNLLAQDYLLKQLTASLIYPESDLGHKFWDRVYSKVEAKYGKTDIPVNTFNKVWVVPDKAVVYEHEGSAYVVESHLKVMLEEDYLALRNNLSSEKIGTNKIREKDVEDLNSVSSEIVREILIPEIEKEVNNGKTFATLRQINNSLILAAWFKGTFNKGLLNEVYVNKNKTKGVDVKDEDTKFNIYSHYLEAFNKGVYNYIKKDYDPVSNKIIPRNYFSGGFTTDLGDGRSFVERVMASRITGAFSGLPIRIQERLIKAVQSGRRVTAELIENASDQAIERDRIAVDKLTLGERIQRWMDSLRFKFVKDRSWRGSEIARNSAPLREEPVLANELARKLYFRMREAAEKGEYIVTGGVIDGPSAKAVAEAGLPAAYFSGWQASHHWGEPDLAKYPYTQVPDKIAEINRVLIKKDEDIWQRFDGMGGILDKIEKLLSGENGLFFILKNAKSADEKDLSGIKERFVTSLKAAVKSDIDIFTDQLRDNADTILNRILGEALDLAISERDDTSQEKRDEIRVGIYSSLAVYLIDYLIPLYADGDTGHQSVKDMVRYFVKAGSASIHIEDQAHGCKKCGHMAGKVLVSMDEHYRRLIEARKEADRLGSEIVIIARTDAEAAKLLQNMSDPRDHYFVKGVTAKGVPPLANLIKLARREVSGYKGTPEQFLARLRVKFPELASGVEEIWRLRGEVKGKRIDEDMRFSLEENGESVGSVRNIWHNREIILHGESLLTTDMVLVSEDGALRMTVQEILDMEPADLESEVAALHRLTDAWGRIAKLKTFSQVVEDMIQDEEQLTDERISSLSQGRTREQILEYWRGFVDPLKGTQSIDQMRRASKIIFGKDIFWDADTAKVYEGYYQIDSKLGLINASKRGRVFAGIADVLWMEQAKPDVVEAKAFHDNVVADSRVKDVLFAINLSPSFNWSNPNAWASILAREEIALIESAMALPGFSFGNSLTWGNTSQKDAVQKMYDAQTNFSDEIGKAGFVFQFVTIFQDHVSSLAMWEAAKRLKTEGAGGFVHGTQQVEQAIGNRFLKHQTHAGTGRVGREDALHERGASAMGAGGKESTEHQFGGKKDPAKGASGVNGPIVEKPVLDVRNDNVIGNLLEAYGDILTPEVMGILESLAPLTAKQNRLMTERNARFVKRSKDREKIGFLSETNPDGSDAVIPGTNITVKDARSGNFEGAPIPKDLLRQWIQLTGPAAKSPQDKKGIEPGSDEWKKRDLRNVIHALLSTADGMMFDGEDALGQLSTMSLDNIRALATAYGKGSVFWEVAEEVAGEYISKGKKPADWNWRELLDTNFTTRIYRTRGLHLDDRHIKYTNAEGKSEAVSATIVDMVLYIVNNYRTLKEQGSSIVLYLPKLQTAEEAAFMAEIMDNIEDKLELERGEIKVFVLIEQLEEAFQLMEMRAALGKHFVGFNTGRWDYIADTVNQNMWDEDWVPPNFKEMTMTYPFMFNYETRVIQAVNTPDKNGSTVLWIGGMEPQIPVIKGDATPEQKEAAIENSMEIAEKAKGREFGRGASGSWAAHPGMVERLRGVWQRGFEGMTNEDGSPKTNLLNKEVVPLGYTDEAARALTELREGERTIAEARFLVSVALQYGNAYLTGRAAAALKGADFFSDPLKLFIMEDMATGEGMTKLLRKWLKAKAPITEITDEDGELLGLNEGDYFTGELVKRIIDQEFQKLLKAPGDIVFEESKTKELPISMVAVETLLLNERDLPWLIDLLNVGLGETDLEAARGRIQDYVARYEASEGLERVTENPLFVAASTGPAMRESGKGLTEDQEKVVDDAIREYWDDPAKTNLKTVFQSDSDIYKIVDPENMLANAEATIVLYEGLIERIVELSRERGIEEAPRDLYTHPGLSRKQLNIDMDVFMKNIFPKDNKWRAGWARHEVAHIENSGLSEEDVQKIAPLPGQEKVKALQESLAERSPVGGINLNPAFIDLVFERDERGIVIPDINKIKPSNVNIDGFLPVIINISPVDISIVTSASGGNTPKGDVFSSIDLPDTRG